MPPPAKKEDSSASLGAEPSVVPPSVRQNEPMVDSYTFHSSDDHAEDTETEYIMGIDEAGRGPVLGPQVYAIAFCKTSYEEELADMGFADSKTLTHEQREGLLDTICNCPKDLKWAVRVMSPHDISRHMLQRTPYNLNAQSHDATVGLIRDALNKHYNITKVYVDTVGPPAAYQAKLQAAFPQLSFTVESKADFKYPIVGAASIAAKVTRDMALAHWTWLEKGRAIPDAPMGSGYPSDPKTVAWLESSIDPIYGLPNVVRFSWATVRTMLEKKAHSVVWNDEPGSIQKFMSGANEPKRPQMMKDLQLHTVAAF